MGVLPGPPEESLSIEPMQAPSSASTELDFDVFPAVHPPECTAITHVDIAVVKNGQSGGRHKNGDILKLQGGDVGRESRHDTGHLPWPQVVARRPHRAAVAEAVVLLQSAHGIRG